MARVVTLSASYGAHGDRVGRLVAEELGLPFLDRAIPAAAAHELALSGDVAESLDEHVPGRWERLAMAFVNVPAPTGPSQLAGPEDVNTPEQFRANCESALREVADTTGAVILGRAGMVALGKRPDVLCVRLDGPAEDRIAQVVAHGIDEETARKGQREVDKARDAYARVFFGARQDDPRLYHVVLDSTALSVQTCVDVIARAARGRFDDSAS
jgi:Cytidylate kinase-like family